MQLELFRRHYRCQRETTTENQKWVGTRWTGSLVPEVLVCTWRAAGREAVLRVWEGSHVTSCARAGWEKEAGSHTRWQ